MKNRNFYTLRLILVSIMLLFVFSNVQAQTIGKNYIAIEAENTASDLGLWKLITPSDSTYFNLKTGVAPINKTHLEFAGNNHNGGEASSPLEYKFTCPKTGEYRLAMRMYQRLLGLAPDKCNDVYVRLFGDFTSASKAYTTDDLKKNMKFYGRGTENWGVCYKGEGGAKHTREAILYNLKKGEEYVFTMSGRAQRTNIDYILFYETSIPLTVKSFVDLADSNDAKYRPVEYQCTTINAVDFDQYTNIEGFADAVKDKKKNTDILSVKVALATAAAQTVYKGKSGKAVFKINTMQETDGESIFVLKVNGVEVGQVKNNFIHGTRTVDYTIQTHVLNRVAVDLKRGDLIQVEFTNATNGLIPEGESTATARGRWVSLEICTMK